MKAKYTKWLLSGVGVLLISSLLAFFPFGSPNQPVSFNEEVRPILNGNCISCHGGVKQNGKLSLLDSESAFKAADSGEPAIMPGEPESSELIRRLLHHDPEERMPLDADPLSEQDISILKKWIKEGANWERHWAWNSPDRNAPVPDIPSSWGYNAVDAFVWRKLRENGLKPAKSADKRTLIRRVYMDLTGLPPSPEEVDAFVQDESSEAYEKVVDGLLASPHFGERWASLWMDLSRYGDSQGYQKDPVRLIWTYRDWLIAAFNEDKPFDQFTIEQLAGDLLEDPSLDQLIATAFHRNTMSNDEGGTDDEEFRVAAVIDRINTTFEIWQGVTMGCVQCHSHPYDPFPHEDYYELMAFFNNTKDADRTDEYPTLRSFSPLQVQEVEDITRWIAEQDPAIQLQKNLSREEKREAVQLPIVPVSKASAHSKLEFCDKRGIKVACYIEDGSWLAFKNLDLSKIGLLSVAYVSGGGGGMMELRLDAPDGELVAEVPLLRTGKWAGGARKEDWKMEPVSTQELSGRHTVYIVFRGVTDQGICDIKGIALHPKSVNGSNEIGREMAMKRQRLYELKPAKTPIMQELPADSSRKTHVFERGNWLVHGEEVFPKPPATIASFSDSYPQNRLGLAQWLVSPENPLTARVMVNRFWEQLFGIGIIETLEDFGTQGAKPSHPELLDWLAIRFQDEHRWSVKSLLKDMVMSATYQQSAEAPAELYQLDPQNRLLARGPRFRLTAEQIRDQALSVSGLLSTKMYGPSVMPPQPEGTWQVIRGVMRWDPSLGENRYRRALYTFWRKSSPYPSMTTFDTPSREFCVSRRIRTNTPLQALVALNDTVFIETAQAFANRMKQEGGEQVADQIAYGYKLALGKELEAEDRTSLLAFYDQTLERYRARPEETCEIVGKYPESPEMAAMINTANVIMNLDEFITKP